MSAPFCKIGIRTIEGQSVPRYIEEFICNAIQFILDCRAVDRSSAPLLFRASLHEFRFTIKTDYEQSMFQGVKSTKFSVHIRVGTKIVAKLMAFVTAKNVEGDDADAEKAALPANTDTGPRLLN